MVYKKNGRIGMNINREKFMRSLDVFIEHCCWISISLSEQNWSQRERTFLAFIFKPNDSVLIIFGRQKQPKINTIYLTGMTSEKHQWPSVVILKFTDTPICPVF